MLRKSHAHKLTIAPRKSSRGKTLNVRKALERLEEGRTRDTEESEELDEIVELENKIKYATFIPPLSKCVKYHYMDCKL